MSFFISYQLSDNKTETWNTVQAEARDQVVANGARHVSVLALNTVPHEDADYDKAMYQGDLVFDIDHKQISASITDLHRLIDGLTELGVDPCQLELYASGSKGFHVVVPSTLFNGKATRHLHRIYAHMAATIAETYGIEGVDMGPYRGRRGSLLRVPNSQRSDGRFKVPITLAEARAMTPETYSQITLAPRPNVGFQKPPKGVPCLLLTAMFDRAKEAVSEESKARGDVASIPSEALAAFGDDRTPVCIEWMTQQLNIAETANLNLLAMNLASYLCAVRISTAKRDSLIELLALNRKNSRTVEERRQRIREKLRYAANGRLAFSCAANCKMLTHSPCAGCPVRAATQEIAQADAGIEEMVDGYYRRGANGTAIRITNFTVEPIASFVRHGNYSKTVDALDLQIKVNGEPRSRALVPSTAWVSVRDLRKELCGVASVAGLSVTGTDADIQNLLAYIIRASEMNEIMHVASAGIHRHVEHREDGDQSEAIDTFVYVEPGWSINADGITGTHVLSGERTGLCLLRKVSACRSGDDKFESALRRLIRANRPHVVGTILGWMVACHLRQHMLSAFSEFPLLHVYGVATSGKTHTSELFSAVAGADYRNFGVLNIPSSSAFPPKEQACSTTTIPRIFDEFNPQGMSENRFLAARDILKASYNANGIPIGTVRAGRNATGSSAATINLTASAPLVFLATQATTSKELQQRSVEVHIDLNSHGEQDYTQNFLFMREHDNWKEMFKLAKLLMLAALKLRVDDVRDMHAAEEPQIPMEIKDRAKRCATTVLCGLTFLAAELRKAGVSEDLAAEVLRLKSAVIEWWSSHAAAIVNRKADTELDQLIRALSYMAAHSSNGVHFSLSTPEHYIRTEHVLYLFIPSCMAIYMRQARDTGMRAEFTDPAQVHELLKVMPYYVGYGHIPGLADGRRFIALKVDDLRRKDIDVELFKCKTS